VVGTALALLYFSLVAWIRARESPDAQGFLIWLPILILDLPVITVVYPLGWIARVLCHAIGLEFSIAFLFNPVFVGVLGSFLYLVAPPAMSAHSRRLWRSPPILKPLDPSKK